MVNDDKRETARIRHSPTKVFLDYDLSILREILDLVRNGEDIVTAKTLRQYEDVLIEAKRLEETANVRRQEEIERQKIEGDFE